MFEELLWWVKVAKAKLVEGHGFYINDAKIKFLAARGYLSVHYLFLMIIVVYNQILRADCIKTKYNYAFR